MGWTKKEENVLKSNGYKPSSSVPDRYVAKNGYGSATRSGNFTSFGNGDKKHDISLSKLNEKTRK
jgi:hypothetical protein